MLHALTSGSPPSPDAALPPLDADEVRALQDVGRAWGPASTGSPAAALPVDPSLSDQPQVHDPSTRGRLVRFEPEPGSPASIEVTSGDVGATLSHRLRRSVLGPPLKSTAMAQERMRKLVALPVLSADALSSVAYGPQAMVVILVLAGGAGLVWALPISAAILLLMVAVGLSYRQTIRAYPHGGGSYIVATENLGKVPGLLAAAGLITDYVLTVAISIASGLAAVSSAIPSLSTAIVPIGVAVIVVLLFVNLRGVRQAGMLFAAPTYAFIVAIALLVVVGLVHAGGRGFHPLTAPTVHASQALGLLLVLRALASGATAMTGIEAISNAVPVFTPVEWKNARTTLTWMMGALTAMFAGVVALVILDGLIPQSNQTLLSQLAHRELGSGVLYGYTQGATALVLLLAANTAYNDFPRVMFLLARDRFAPARFLRMGDRLAFNDGLIILSIVAALIFVAFGGDTEALIPLYAVGVFLAFTLSQAGMVVHWWRLRTSRWRLSIALNGAGCVLSALVFVIAGSTKFMAGAWLALLIVVGFTTVGLLTRRHFDHVEDALALDGATTSNVEPEETPVQMSNLMIVPVPQLNRGTVRALAYAVSLKQPVLALHVSPTEAEASRFSQYWTAWGDHVPLEILQSPYRAVIAPTIAYIEGLRAQQPNLTLTVIVADVTVRHRWQRTLHDDTATRLRRALEPLDKVVVTSIPIHLDGVSVMRPRCS